MYTLLYFKWITNTDLLYSTRNSAPCYVAAWMGGEFGGEWIHVICMAESLSCPPETITPLLISSTPIQKKKGLEGDTAKVKGLRTEGHTVQSWNPDCCCPACDPGWRHLMSLGLSFFIYKTKCIIISMSQSFNRMKEKYVPLIYYALKMSAMTWKFSNSVIVGFIQQMCLSKLGYKAWL